VPNRHLHVLIIFCVAYFLFMMSHKNESCVIVTENFIGSRCQMMLRDGSESGSQEKRGGK